MLAMVLEKIGEPLKEKQVPVPSPDQGEILIKIAACGVCRTDLHVIDGELKETQLPLIPGHQIVGHVVKLGGKISSFKLNDPIGVSWLGYSCGHCPYCLMGNENLCDNAKFTGYQINGGFAEYCVAKDNVCFPIPKGYSDLEAAPLLCAGLIGYRAYKKLGKAKRIGLYGFGSAAHILVQVAKYNNQEVYAFTRPGDQKTADFALKLGADWAGPSNQSPALLLDGAIIFAPVGELIPQALKSVRKGGIVVCAGIHMSDIPSFPYEILWGEKTVCSIANLRHKEGEEFLNLTSKIPVKTIVQVFSLKDVNKALDSLRSGQLLGTAVIKL